MTANIHAAKTQPELSVIIPVLNEAKYLPQVVDDLIAQTLKNDRYEILIIDGNSVDGTLELSRVLAQKHQNISLHESSRKRSSASRNIGARAAKGKYLLFVDGHCVVPSPTMLADVLDAFKNGEQCLSRPQPLFCSSDNQVAASIVAARASVFGHLPGSHIFSEKERYVNPSSAGFAYTKGLYLAIDGYDESFDACEDVDFNTRIHQRKIQAFHSPRFQVNYVARQDWSSLGYQMRRYGFGRAKLWAKDPRGFSFAAAVPALGIVGVLFSIILSMVGLVAWWGPLLFLLPSMFLALCCGVAVGFSVSPRIGIFAVVTNLVIFVSAGLGYLLGCYISVWHPSWPRTPVHRLLNR